MTALLAGASGLIGRELARQWDGPGLLHLLVRRPLEIRGVAAPLQRVHLLDFAALPALPRAVEAYCCLGTTIKAAGSQAAFRAVDFDAVLAFARAAQSAGVQRFAVVSASIDAIDGSNAAGPFATRSSFRYARPDGRRASRSRGSPSAAVRVAFLKIA